MTASSPTTAETEATETVGLYRKASALAGAQAIGLVVPLITVPYLARVLGPDAWGPVIAAQALGNWLLLLLEFGFELSATRAVARARTAPETMSDLVHGVQSAKLVLVIASIPILAAVMFLIPTLRADMELALWAFAFAALRGYSPLWFYQGIERQAGATYIDTASKALAALGVFVVVRGPGDGVRVLELQAIFAALSLAVLTAGMRGHVSLQRPAFEPALRTLREGWSMFAMRASSSLYIQANALILSALASAATVAFYGGAERIIRAAINLLQPLTQVFLPRVSYLHASDPEAAKRIVRHALLFVGGVGLVMGLVASVGAPLLVRVLLGPGYETAIPVLRLFGLLPLLVAITTVLGIYWAIPFGHDRAVLIAILSAGIVNVVLAFALVPRWGALGMAGSAIFAEVVVLVFFATLYFRHRSRA